MSETEQLLTVIERMAAQMNRMADLMLSLQTRIAAMEQRERETA